MSPSPISRRTTFTGLAALGAALVLAGCAGDDSASGPQTSSGEVLARTDEVPVGGGLVLSDKKVVLTQPVAGEFHAFSAVCTHQAATVSAVSEQGIHCPLHGSVFSAVDGSVVQAPAASPLPQVDIEVVDGEIRVA